MAKKITKTTSRKGNKKITVLIEEELNPTPVTVTVFAPELTNHVIFLLDDSGSMRNCYAEAVRQLNLNIANVREQARKMNQKTTVSIYYFGGAGVVTCRLLRQPVEAVQDLNPRDFAQGYSTPLRDAICSAITDGLRAQDSGNENTSFLLICATDGGENSSRLFQPWQLDNLIRQVQATDRWTLAFMTPYGMKSNLTSLGIPAGNVTEWSNTAADAVRVGQVTVASTSNYYASRSLGMKSVQKFYDTTDLSKITAQDLTRLQDVTNKFKPAQVDAESDIKAFAEERTGRPYVVGSLYYALTKKEKVQAGKDMLLVEKGKRTIYGGPEVRTLVGVRSGAEVMVTPGNHANFDVYVKSTSVNRKLVRGTKVLIDLTKTVADTETWDSATALAMAELKKALAQTT
jgi:hypothetical protein